VSSFSIISLERWLTCLASSISYSCPKTTRVDMSIAINIMNLSTSTGPLLPSVTIISTARRTRSFTTPSQLSRKLVLLKPLAKIFRLAPYSLKSDSVKSDCRGLEVNFIYQSDFLKPEPCLCTCWTSSGSAMATSDGEIRTTEPKRS
jgi:hypothetical protein